MALRRNHRKTISGIGHVQVGDEHVETLGCDMPQSFCHASGSDQVNSSSFERRIHHGANAVAVIDEQDSVQNGLLGWSHAVPPLRTVLRRAGNDENLLRHVWPSSISGDVSN
jgi:hypothetical protein